MSPTIYDIARVAGVSKSTVSRVLNKQTNISPEARDKVLKAIDELNYQPNKLARALTSSGFDAIMVISTRSTKTTAGNPFSLMFFMRLQQKRKKKVLTLFCKHPKAAKTIC